MTQGERQRLRSDEEVVKELCMANGVSYEKIAQEGSSVNSLEIFLSGFPRMVGLSFFPRLCQLTIVGQDVKDIEGLECCPLLQELWIAQCHLTEISGLENCLQLKKLYLYENQISEIKNLEWQTNVEVLWLNNNRITQIQGLNTLKNLKELNLADNSIKRIGHCLDPNVNLQNLNLSGNKISSFKELTMLAYLPHLGELALNDPMSTPNPVCLLYNYPTHVLYHMPGLQHLDTYDVSGVHLKEAAEFTVMKKIMYYNMRVHSAQRSLAEIRFSLLEKKRTLLQIPEECIRTLSTNLKSLERELCMRSACSYEDVPPHAGDGLTDSNGPGADINWDPTMEYKILRKIEALRDRLAQWTKKLSEIEAWFERDLAQATRMMDYTIQFLLVELEGVGNIRLEEGSPTDLWFTTCYDLLLSRFSHSEYRSLGIMGIKMTRVIRIHNRALQLRFEEKLQNLLSNEESIVLSQNSRRRLDHLFYIGDPGKSGEKEEILSIVENGFKSPEEFKASGRDGAVPLSNSLFASDQLRIEHAVHQAKQAATKSKLNSTPFRHGQIIISKVFVGHSTPIRHGVPVERSNFPRNFSVYRNVHRSGLSEERSRSSKSHSGSEGSPRRRNWLVFDHELVQPEYIVYFEYITGDQEYPPLLDRKTDRYDHSANDVILDKEVLNMEPQLKQHPKLLSLTEKTLLHVAKANVLSQITMLNLHSNSLSRIKEISSLTALRHLTLTFNEFTHLEDISHMPHLEYLDASYNRLATLEGLKGLGQLKQLDVRWNKLTNVREDTSVLKKHTPALLRLDTRFNPWNKPETVRTNILGCLTKLTHLDDVLIEEEEAADAVQMVAASKINQASLLAHSRTSNERPRRLSLLSTAQLLHLLTPAPWGLARQLEPDWTEKITALNLDNQRISKLTNLNKLVNLRWASFNNNVISKVEGLDCCSKLEELFLNNNCISALSGFSKLLCLTKLSMDGNQLSVLDSSVLDQLPNMTFLSVENNCITSLTGIEKARSLLELYIGNNQITTSRDIYYLKGLTNLIILDLYGNPLVGRLEASYRIYVVFHLPSLRALDGVAVEVNECENAKDMFEGRLTSDMLAEKLGHSNYTDITYLTLQCCSIRTVDLSPTDLFGSLRSVNLDHNNLTSFSGLVYLPNVKALCLNNNHIKSILPRQKTQSTSKETLYSKVHSSGYGQQNPSKVTRDAGGAGSLEPLMGSLEVLHLSHNSISNMANLQLSRLPNLKALFLQGNEISQVEGLEGLHQLRQLVLNRNRIKALTKNSFTSQSVLLELHLAENRIRDLSHLCPLTELRKLYLGMNKLQDVAELDKLEVLPSLTELSVVGNPLARTSLHRTAVVLRLSQLQILDGVMVTIEERTRAELLSGETSLKQFLPLWREAEMFMFTFLLSAERHARKICGQCPGAALAAEINLPGFLPLMPHNIPLRGMSISGLQNFAPAHSIFPHSLDDVQSQYSYKDKKLRHSNAARSCQTDMTFRHYRRTGDSLASTGLFSDVNRVIITYPSQEQDSRFPQDGKPPHL